MMLSIILALSVALPQSRAVASRAYTEAYQTFGKPSKVEWYTNGFDTVALYIWYDHDISAARLADDPSVGELNPHREYVLDDQNYFIAYINDTIFREGYYPLNEIVFVRLMLLKWLDSKRRIERPHVPETYWDWDKLKEEN